MSPPLIAKDGQVYLDLAPRTVTWDCSSPGGICLRLTCPDNMIGAEVKDNGTLVIGAGGGGKGGKGGKAGLVFPLETRDGPLTVEDAERREGEAVELVVRMADTLFDAMGSTCRRDVESSGEPMGQTEVGHAMGLTRQRVQQVERVALLKLRRNREAAELARLSVEDEGGKVMAEGCGRRGAVRHEG